MAGENVQLPSPQTAGGIPLAQALQARRSVRSFQPAGLTLAEIGQLLWSSQGISSRDGLRTAPSAGALYPLEIHLAAGAVDSLDSGVYHYAPQPHRLLRVQAGDVRAALAAAALHQSWLADAAAVLVYSAVYTRTTDKYGHRGVRYVHMEVGHAAQNALLQATASGLHGCIVGAFDDAAVQRVLALPADCAALCLMPLGRQSERSRT